MTDYTRGNTRHDTQAPPSDVLQMEQGREYKLPRPFQILYALNGMTEAFPMLALMAMINDRIEIPVTFLPAYYSIAFLPYSLKPIYAMAAKMVSRRRRHTLLIVLLIFSGISWQYTAFLKKGQVVRCFMVAFFRGVFVSGAEFMVGLGLLSCASSASVGDFKLMLLGEGDGQQDQEDERMDLDATHGDMSQTRQNQQQRQQEVILSCFQSDAATCRNVGSFMSQVISFGILLFTARLHQEEKDKVQSQMSNGLITVMFLISSFFPFAAAFVAAKYRVGSSIETEMHLKEKCVKGGQQLMLWNILKYDLVGLLIFQLLLLWVGIRSIVISNTSNQLFFVCCFILVICLIISLMMSRSKRLFASNITNTYSAANISNDESLEKERSESTLQHVMFLKKVALYLILRHSMPSGDIVLSSYVYTVFRSRPFVLQAMSILGSGVAVVSTWMYGRKVAAKYSSLDGIKHIIAWTTTACAIWALFTIPFIHFFRKLMSSDEVPGGIVLLVFFAVFRLVTGFLSEMSFMPSIVVATTTTIHTEKEQICIKNEDNYDEGFVDDTIDHGSHQGNEYFPFEKNLDTGIQYGLLLSCIDFGDQMSNFVSMPLIEFLKIGRENDWQNLEWFIFICSILAMCSLLFLRLLNK